jgi:hypothetical protein
MDITARLVCGAAPKKAEVARLSGYPCHSPKRGISAEDMGTREQTLCCEPLVDGRVMIVGECIGDLPLVEKVVTSQLQRSFAREAS